MDKGTPNATAQRRRLEIGCAVRFSDPDDEKDLGALGAISGFDSDGDPIIGWGSDQPETTHHAEGIERVENLREVVRARALDEWIGRNSADLDGEEIAKLLRLLRED